MYTRTAVVLALACSASAFSPMMMCASPGAGEGAEVKRSRWTPPASRRAIDEARLNPKTPAEGTPKPGLGRRGAFGALFKGAAAVAVGEALITDMVEAGAARAGAGLVAEEVAAGGAAVEGAAMLRNGQVVMGEMEKQIFGKAITRGLL